MRIQDILTKAELKYNKKITNERTEYITTYKDYIKRKELNKQFNYGSYNLETTIDLQDHRRRTKYKSELRNQFGYGAEWKAISNNAREKFDYTCQECNRVTIKQHLHVHHKYELLRWINTKSGLLTNTFTSFGVETNKPWHSEDNLEVLCSNCHSKYHLHMTAPGTGIYL